MDYSLGVDLGTTFVAAAIARHGGLEMVALGDGSMVAPSAVYLRDDGVLVTGDAAARRAVSNPDRVAHEIKRSLGNPTPIILGGTPYPVTDLLGTLLKEVLDRVTRVEGGPPRSVALTHPANWGPFRRELFDEVAAFAGLAAPVSTTEPEAAAAHYASTRELAPGETIAVYDLGGGTFDATVLRRTGIGFEILGIPEGIERLGGVDFDEAVLAHVNYASGGALAELDLGDPRTVVALARLRQDCILAKEALSVDLETTITVFLPGRHFEVPLTRAEFEGMIRAPIESTIGTLDRVLRAAQVAPGQLAAVLLAGGSSRIPLVARMIGEQFGRPTVVGTHPKHSVALGAALLADTLTAAAPTVVSPAAVSSGGNGRHAGDPRAAGHPPGTSVPAAAAQAPPTATPAVSPQAGPQPGAPAQPGAVPAAPAAVAAPAAARGGPPPSGREPTVALPAVSPGGPSGPPAQQPPGGWPAPGGGGPQGPVPPPRHAAEPGGVPPVGPPPQGPAKEPWGGLRLPLIIGLLVVLLVGGGVVAYLTLRPGKPTPPAATQTGTSKGPSAGSAAPPAPASSVPIPSIGATIPVGNTPNYVAASPNGRQLYVAGGATGVVTVVDTAVDKVTATIRIPAGPPQFLTFSPDGHRLYVSVWNDARTIADVAVLDTTDNSIIATIKVHTRPFLGAVTPNGKLLYVPNHDSGTVTVIDTTTNKLVTEFKVPPNPHWVAFTPDGSRAYIACHESNVVAVVDTSDNHVIAQIPVATSPHSVAVHPTRPLAIVANYDNASVQAIDTSTNTASPPIPVGKNPQHVAFSADGRFAYISNNSDNTVSVVSVDTLQVTATIPVGASPTSVAVLPDGRKGYVSNFGAGTLTVLNLAG